jgi:hypothetical protein
MRRNSVLATAVSAGVAVVGAILAPSAAAEADPALPPVSDTPVEPADLAAAPTPSTPPAPGQLPDSGTAPASPVATVMDMVAQARAIDATDPTVLLGQRPDAAGLDAPPLGPLSFNPLNNANLLPQNLVPSAPGEGTVVGVEPGQEAANTTFRGYLSRLKDMYHNGDLAGAGLGQRPLSELGGPPPAGTAEPVPPDQPPAPPPTVPPIPPSAR